MFVDASALVAIFTREPEAGSLAARIDSSAEPFTSPLALFETVVAVARKSKHPVGTVAERVETALKRLNIAIRPIDAGTGELALSAADRYGKGTGHPARLNMGDCFAYAMAKQHGVQLLYKGDDFALTDLA